MSAKLDEVRLIMIQKATSALDAFRRQAGGGLLGEDELTAWRPAARRRLEPIAEETRASTSPLRTTGPSCTSARAQSPAESPHATCVGRRVVRPGDGRTPIIEDRCTGDRLCGSVKKRVLVVWDRDRDSDLTNAHNDE